MSNNDKLELSLKEYLDGKFAEFNRRMDERFAKFNRQFDGVNRQFDGVNQQFDGLNQQFDGVNQQFDGVNQQFDGVNQQFDGVNQRIDDKYVADKKATEAHYKPLYKKINLIYGLVLLLLIIIIALIAKDYLSPNQNAETAMLVEMVQRILQEKGGDPVD